MRKFHDWLEQRLDEEIGDLLKPATWIAAWGAMANPASLFMMTPVNLIRAIVMFLIKSGWAAADIMRAIKSIPEIAKGDLSSLPPVGEDMLDALKTGANELYQALVGAPSRIASAHLGGEPDSYGNELRRAFGYKMYKNPVYGSLGGYKESLSLSEKMNCLRVVQ